ncbi:MAG: hypothetical protein K0R51_502 [Cytophagaceae bacterium]|jgi:uncharacterized membrane protein YfhO|nr:hypothetical protein [Cytophagaceae bacterium]
MKNKIYPFLLGLSCILIVALVSFKNSEKAVEKEQMIIIIQGSYGKYEMSVSTSSGYENIKLEETTKSAYNYSMVLNKIQEFQKSGWVVSNNSIGFTPYGIASNSTTINYTLERDKQ